MKEYQYKIRAHHGMCICFFDGKGYSNEFTKHMAEIIHKLNENPVICISDETDIICEKCPNNKNGVCETADKVAEYDKQVLLRCGLVAGEMISFSEFRDKVYENIIRPGKREDICGNCQWTSICHLKGNDNDIEAPVTLENRCDICGLWEIDTTAQCPECGGIIDLAIEGLSLSWTCRECAYAVATTANKLCVWDEKKYPKDCYGKLNTCPYAEKL